MIYLKIILLIGSLIVGIGIGYKYQDMKVQALKTEIKALQSDLTNCQEVNKSNQKAVTSLQDDVKKANKSCTTRINEKNALIKKLTEIDTLQPIGGKDENTGNTGVDPILDRLNRLFL